MNFEETIKAKHVFEDRLREFLDLASVMTDRELEIALARLADVIPQQTEARRLQSLFKGKLLNEYLKLRRSGGKEHKKFRRLLGPDWKTLPSWASRESIEDYFLRCTAEATVIPEGMSIEDNSVVTEADMARTVKLLAP